MITTLYTRIVRPILFRLNAETAHTLALRGCEIAGRYRFTRRMAHRMFSVEHPSLRTTVAGIQFANPIGLAAGFDKNGHAIEFLGELGFGHVEIGSISAYPSNGNPPPRLFRIPRDKGIIVYYGVPNEGARMVSRRLENHRCSVPLGINLVKTNDAKLPAEDPDVIDDYYHAFATLERFAGYMTLNMSCPNCARDRDFFDDIGRTRALLSRLSSFAPRAPVFLKLKPTTDRRTLLEIVSLADAFPFVAGFAINLPAGKPPGLDITVDPETLATMPGSVSGKPVARLIDANLRLLAETIGPRSRYRLMCAGGVFTAEDAYRKIRLGASLVQLYTALVYQGPGIVRTILNGLARLLERDGYANVEDAVGADVWLTDRRGAIAHPNGFLGRQSPATAGH